MLMSFTEVGNFSAIMSSNTFSTLHFLLFLGGFNDRNIKHFGIVL